MALVFDADHHVYTLDGVVLPSVTEVLSAQCHTNGSEYYTDESRYRGHYVHAALALEHEGALDDECLVDAFTGYIDAYRHFRREVDFRPICWEEQVYDAERGYAGTFDVIGRVGPDPLTPPLLLDFKTGQPQVWTCLQTAAYARCKRGPAFPVLRRACLALRPDGTYRFTMHTDRADERLFLSALEVYQWTTSHS